MVLPMAICEICPAVEADVMISVLLNLFDTRTSLMTLLKLMIDREIAHTGRLFAWFDLVICAEVRSLQKMMLRSSEVTPLAQNSFLHSQRSTDTIICGVSLFP
jgi:hypothetical protein